MRIGIDLHTVTSFMQGTRTYTLGIVNELLKIDQENQYNFYVTDANSDLHSIFTQNNVVFRHVVPHNRLIRIPISLPIRLAMDSIDIFHCQYMGPPFSKTPYVVMIHDIIHEYMPEYYPRSLCYMMRMLYPVSARRASRVLTVSESSKRDIVKYFKIPEEKVIVTYNGVADDFYQERDRNRIQNTLDKYNINGDYILYVGRLEPRKNLPRLIRAFYNVKKGEGISHKLVIVGMKYFRQEEIYDTIKKLNLRGEVVFTGRVEDDELSDFYQGATLFVYPAIAEGFGIPPLEAMASGTPVITSNTSSLPEVVGDAGVLIDPYRTDDIAGAMYKVLSDKNIQKKMKKEGLKRARSFSWKVTARKTLDVFHEVYEETGKRRHDKQRVRG
jgi:glycosyltransferase involved in cell wall biosynthesis